MALVATAVQKTKYHIDGMLHPKRMWIILACAALVVSCIAVCMQPYRRSIILWFPESKTGKLKAEMRLVPWHSEKTDAVSIVAEELLLGPANPKLKPFADQQARVLEVIQTKDRFIVVLDSKALFISSSRSDVPEYSNFFEALAKSVAYNIGIRHISIAIEGHIVFSQ